MGGPDAEAEPVNEEHDVVCATSGVNGWCRVFKCLERRKFARSRRLWHPVVGVRFLNLRSGRTWRIQATSQFLGATAGHENLFLSSGPAADDPDLRGCNARAPAQKSE
jgi:hypothetical protein